MTQITIYRNQNREVERFTCSGHAGYGEYGRRYWNIPCDGTAVAVREHGRNVAAVYRLCLWNNIECIKRNR